MIHEFDPLLDPRWPEFIRTHPAASVFHTPGWLRALAATYGYRPVAITTSRPGAALTNGIAFCVVRTWLTGTRLVSLPFADHCEPLAHTSSELSSLLEEFPSWMDRRVYGYAEFRPLRYELAGHAQKYSNTQDFCFHELDLRPALADLRRNFHKDCIERKIRRAQREQLRVEVGDSDALIRTFYRLQVMTRQRQGSFPQPFQWFRNLRDTLAGSLRITAAFLRDVPVASILTLQYEKTLMYKYGCSDARYHSLGAMPLLFWSEIVRGKSEGLESFDMGRSDRDTLGLIEFKNRWGARSSPLRYYRHPAGVEGFSSQRLRNLAKIFAKLPQPALSSIGRIAYRHLG